MCWLQKSHFIIGCKVKNHYLEQSCYTLITNYNIFPYFNHIMQMNASENKVYYIFNEIISTK